MELWGDKHHAGKQYLTKFSTATTQYPWDYWIGLSLWTGEYLYFKNGVDFSCGTKNFRTAAHHAAKVRQVEMKATYKDLPNDEIKIAWFYSVQWDGEDPNEDMIIPGMRTGFILPELLEQDPELRRLVEEGR